jgi:hypothetical protein
VPEFIDRMLAWWFTGDERDQFVRGLAAIQTSLRPDNLEDRTSSLRSTSASAPGRAAPRTPGPGSSRWTVYGYFTSSVVQEEVLRPVIMPGRYRGMRSVGTMTMRRQDSWDAIVVGSGITGGWAAKDLTEAGLRVLVARSGAQHRAHRDYVEHVQAWQMPYRGWGDRRALEQDYAIQRKCYACDEWSSKFFVNDRENPYIQDAGTAFDWIRGRHVGGRSITWGRQVYRWSDLDFDANARDGVGVDWPIRYKDIEPWVPTRRALHRRNGTAGRTRPAARRRVPAAHGDELRRARRRRRDPETVGSRPRDDDRARGDPHPGPQWSRRLSLLRSLRAWLHHALLLHEPRQAPCPRRAPPDGSHSGPTAWFAGRRAMGDARRYP